MSESKAELQRQIDALGPWFHNLHLPGGLQTLPDHFLGGDFPSFKWEQIRAHVPEDLSGWRVLDVGCNAGFYSFELARRGASVLAIDMEPLYLAQARWAAKQYGLQDRVELRQLQVYDLARSNEAFDLVWFMGVFYHLRYPLLALDTLARRTRRMMMFQTLSMPGEAVYPDTSDHPITEREPLLDPGWPKMAFIEHKFSGDRTNWWVPNHAGIEAMLRSSGLRVTARPAEEIYVCVPNPESAAWQWDTQYQAVFPGAQPAVVPAEAGTPSIPARPQAAPSKALDPRPREDDESRVAQPWSSSP